ncbi:MAG: 7-cyano-7-deazaguanine synthase QueC [Burkholderiales bacterium]|jgi:7-cyano-7-deazaguanine synthase|nr:7-cyano-7-deazaguanine synthase QueC [Pseudomonadota bacterium]MDA1012196.1 7-cyano-7-deazaguanine synthase QueC [Pseudomonadota bacterium]
MSIEQAKAVILVSGGLDSATTIAYAQSKHFLCHALSIDYGQRHISELNFARGLCGHFNVAEHKVIKVDLAALGGSALTDTSQQIPTEKSAGIPSTYVPARNTIMLSIALGWAEVLGAQDVFIGANAVDYSGYPDCRPEYIDAYERVANLATKAGVEGSGFRIHAPLIDLKKADIIKVGYKLGVDFSQTISCYQASPSGAACGICDSCRIRKEGFLEAEIDDPTVYV